MAVRSLRGADAAAEEPSLPAAVAANAAAVQGGHIPDRNRSWEAGRPDRDRQALDFAVG